MKNVYAGIDIGLNGAIAVIRDNKIMTYPMPLIQNQLDIHALGRLISTEVSPLASITEEKVHVVFEKLGVIYGSSKQTAFSMGMQSGAVETFCICAEMPYTKVRAVDWQKAMFQGVTEIKKKTSTSRDTKAMALVAIKRIFPQLKLTFGKGVKPHDGLIDAVLMAEYARRLNL